MYAACLACGALVSGCSLIDAFGAASTPVDGGGNDGGGDAGGPPVGDPTCNRVSYEITAGPLTEAVMTRIEVIDVNNDGRLDLVTAGNAQLGVVLGEPTGAGLIQSYNQVFALGGGPTEQLAVGDFNGDGFGDAVASFVNMASGDSPRMAFGSVGGMFGDAFTVLHGGARHGFAVGDYAPGGVAQDLVSVRLDTAIVWQWDGDSLEIARTITLPASSPDMIAPWRTVRGRFDADASDDFAIASAEGGVHVLEQVQPGDFVARTMPDLTQAPLVLAAGNLDNAGGDDLIFVVKAATGEQDVIVRLDSGGTRDLLSASFFPDNVVAGDVDRDGHVDVITTGLTGVALVFFGDGTGGFPCHQTVALPGDPGWVAVGSLFDDSKLDVATVGSQGLSWALSFP